MGEIDDHVDRFAECLKEPHLYGFARRIAEAKAATAPAQGNVVQISNGQLNAARKALAQRHSNALTALSNIEYTVHNLRELQERKRCAPLYHRHDLMQAWRRLDVDAFELSAIDAELGKSPSLSLELSAIRGSHIINTGGHLHAFKAGDSLRTGLRNAAAGAAMSGIGATYGISQMDAPSPVNLLAMLGAGLLTSTGAALAYANIADIKGMRTVDPFAAVADELERREAYIRNALK